MREAKQILMPEVLLRGRFDTVQVWKTRRATQEEVANDSRPFHYSAVTSRNPLHVTKILLLT